MAVRPDGKLAVSASEDNTLRVWKVGYEAGGPTAAGHTEEVNSMAMTPDGTLAISASDDGTLKVWEVATGREVRT